MENLRLRLLDAQVVEPVPTLPSIGRFLVDEGIIDQRDLVNALDLQCRVDVPLGEILISEGHLSRAEFLQAMAKRQNLPLVDLNEDPCPMELADTLPSSLCQTHQVVPWARMGASLLVATARPDTFKHFRACMGHEGNCMLAVVADEYQIQTQLGRLYGREFAQKAATRVPVAESCRAWEINPQKRRLWALGILSALALATLLAPMWVLTIAILWTFMTLVMSTTLKASALIKQFPHRNCDAAVAPEGNQRVYRLPRVSVLVPLLREKEIAEVLIKRLSRLTYPKSLLNVVLVLEAGDDVTRDTLARTTLPDWINVIEVPEANRLTTKPRALNYALDFCKGSIIGIWDAEDAPEPDQIEKVVNRFRTAPPEVACLQGRLDYYNSRTNWLSRCFTIEYATWWRMVLPGIARLGLVVPLGGTTLFFRRNLLEELGGWDAHNVTEDADLGLRLARHGYRTELLPTVTYEEANCRAWPWVRQRSRWLKGFLITWCVHMRTPSALLKDLGWLRFLGVQTLFLATFSQFLMAPLLWSFWLTIFGMPHPIGLTLGAPVMWFMIVVFVVAEATNLAISMTAVSTPRHRHLLGWVLTTPFYYLLGALSAVKALHEFVVSPFFWDKTQHGFAAEENEGPSPLPYAAPRPASAG